MIFASYEVTEIAEKRTILIFICSLFEQKALIFRLYYDTHNFKNLSMRKSYTTNSAIILLINGCLQYYPSYLKIQ